MTRTSKQGASPLRATALVGLRLEPPAEFRPFGDHHLRGGKIRLRINHEHIARILAVRRALCIGEKVRAA